MNHDSHDHTGHQPAAVHGMLLFGQQKIYLSHLPMFSMPEHCYQVILEVTLTKAGKHLREFYLQDRKANPQTKFYTFMPEPFILSELDPHKPLRKSFTGELVRGHFERKGVLIAEPVTATITNIIHFRPFDVKARPLANLEYILFGQGKELFLAHHIIKPPDFDQILEVSGIKSQLTDTDLAKGPVIQFKHKSNTIQERLKSKGNNLGTFFDGQQKAHDFRIGFGKEIYFESGELAE